MNDRNPLHMLGALLAPDLGLVVARAERGRLLEQWGLNPHRADPDTLMAHDDAEGFDEKIPEGVAGAALFPIMNAADALAAADILITTAASSAPFNHHTPAFLSLCRTAIECSSQAIWILSPIERNIRRKRAAGLAKIGIEHLREFLLIEIEAHDNGLRELSSEKYEKAKNRLKFHTAELDTLERLDPQNGRKYSELVRKASNWIQENPPGNHPELEKIHYPTHAKQQYRVCSSFTHGHSWPIDLIAGPLGMFAMMADAIFTALVTTESAICLYEAQSTDPDRSRKNYYPHHLQETIDEYRSRYSGTA